MFCVVLCCTVPHAHVVCCAELCGGLFDMCFVLLFCVVFGIVFHAMIVPCYAMRSCVVLYFVRI